MEHTTEWHLNEYHWTFGAFVYDGEPLRKILDHHNPVPSCEEEVIYELYVREIFTVLTPWQRRVALLRFAGYDNDSIAKEHGCGTQNIRNTLGKIRKRLANTSLRQRKPL